MKYVIDISDYQSNIDWSELSKHCSGVIVKISEGCTLSRLLGKHIAAAAARGVPWGVYCYTHATTAARARQEAQTVIQALRALGYGNPKLGAWIDIEDRKVLSILPDTVTACASAFISAFNGVGIEAGIYASLSTYRTNLKINLLADYVPYWCAQYGPRCRFKDYFPKKKLKGWQYTDGYTINGKKYDRNEWY